MLMTICALKMLVDTVRWTFLEYDDLIQSSSNGWVSRNVAKNADRNFKPGQASMARWPETAV